MSQDNSRKSSKSILIRQKKVFSHDVVDLSKYDITLDDLEMDSIDMEEDQQKKKKPKRIR